MSDPASDRPAIAQCPFCLADKVAAAPVCPVCNRDTMPPPALLAERDELLQHRDALRAKIEAAMKRLTA